jgi:hypothetical protein
MNSKIGPIEEIPHTPKRTARSPSTTGRSAALRALEVGQSRLFLCGNRYALNSLCHHVLGKGNYSIRKEKGYLRVYRLGAKEEA